MSTEQIVTDIDSTILRTERRLWKVLEDLGQAELFPQLRARYDGVRALLDPEEQERFYQLFLSGRYLQLDEPLPGAAEALRALRGAGYRITYLTGRHDALSDSMRLGTEEWLVEHGFPHPQDGSTLLLMKPQRRMDDRSFKEEALQEILKLGPIRAGIGDRASDVEAYLSQGIRSIIIGSDHYPRDGLHAVENQAEIVRDWMELKALLLG